MAVVKFLSFHFKFQFILSKSSSKFLCYCEKVYKYAFFVLDRVFPVNQENKEKMAAWVAR